MKSIKRSDSVFYFCRYFLLFSSINQTILHCSGFLSTLNTKAVIDQIRVHRGYQVTASNSPTTISRLYALDLRSSNPTELFNADIERIVARTKPEHSNFNSIHAAEHAERMLMQMISMYHDSRKKTARPNIESFRLVLSGYANLGGSRWDEENFIETMSYYTPGSRTSLADMRVEKDCKPSEEGTGPCNSICAIDRIESILGELHKLVLQEGTKSVENLRLDTEVLNLILKTYAHCTEQQLYVSETCRNLETEWPWLSLQNENKEGYAERAEKTLEIMMLSNEMHLKPNAESISHVIKAWARQQPARIMAGTYSVEGNDTCVKRGEKWLLQLETMYEDGKCQENTYVQREMRRLLFASYSNMIEAWSRTCVNGSSAKAYECMLRLEALCSDDMTERQCFKKIENYSSKPLLPPSKALTSTIVALSKERDADSAHKANQLLNRMISLYESGEWGGNKPDVVSFNAVISAWAHNLESGSAEKADKVFNTMKSLYFDKTKPNYNHLRPDTVSFNSVITAWANCNEAAAVTNALAYMKQMDDHYHSAGSNFLDVQPDAYTYNLCISAWVRSNLGVPSAENAERLLLDMIDRFLDGDDRLTPNQKIFSAVINAWAKCGDKSRAVSKSMNLIHKMETLHERGMVKLKPDIIAYTTCIDAIAKSRLPNGAEPAFKMLEKVEQLYLTSQDLSMKPSVQTYSCVLQTLVHSRTIENDRKAQEILNRMKRIGVQPNAFTLNCAINAASSVVGSDDRRMESFKVALKAFSTLINSADLETDSFTYTFFLKACLNLLPPDEKRHQIVKKTFLRATKEGKVNNQVITKFCMCLGSYDAKALLRLPNKNSRDIRINDLPREWSQNKT